MSEKRAGVERGERALKTPPAKLAHGTFLGTAIELWNLS